MVSVGMKKVSLKSAQKLLQSCITWTKKSSTGHGEWMKACIEAGLPSRKLKTHVKPQLVSQVVLIQVQYASMQICKQIINNKVNYTISPLNQVVLLGE